MPQLDLVLLSDARVLAAWLIFFGSYFVFALGKFPWMKLDRPGAAIIGAVLMVAFRIVGPPEALQAIDFPTIVLLFSMMLIVANLRLGGFFEHIGMVRRAPAPAPPAPDRHLHLWTALRLPGERHRVPGHDALRPADGATPGLPPVPYLLAVATASNIGSVTTITGNPQNILAVPDRSGREDAQPERAQLSLAA